MELAEGCCRSVMSSHTVVCERVCNELQRPVMSAMRLCSEEGLQLAHGSSSLALCARI